MTEKDKELLKRNYRLDEKNRIFTIVLHYDSASELVDKRVSAADRVTLSDEISDILLHYLDDIPKGYQCNVDMRIDDYEGYQPKALESALKHMLALDHLRYRRDKRKQRLLTAALLCAGVVFMVIMALASGHALFNNETADEIAAEILDIAGWVFIWEAFTVRFLTPSEALKKGVAFLSKINQISFSNSEKQTLVTCNHDEIYNALQTK